MKFIVGVDLEGLACVVGAPGRTLTDSPDCVFARRQAVREANAAAGALFNMGAQQVIIWDNHGSSLNLPYDELDERCDVALGVGNAQRWPGLDSSFAGVLFIGYHPMDNTIDGVLAHTFSSISYQYIKVNGVEVGEMAIDAAIAGELGVPLIFAASDDKGIAEVQRFMPWVETVTTKRGLGRNMAVSKHPLRAAQEINQRVQVALGRLEEMQPFLFAEPAVVEIRYKRLEDAQAAERAKQGWKRLDPYTVEKEFTQIDEWL